MTQEQSQPKRIFPSILALVTFCCIVIILLEAMLWIVFPVSTSEQEIEETVSQNIPGLKQTIVYRTRRYGVRSLSEVTEEKPNNTIRILCIGASTTDQPTQETADTWSGILETKLRDHFIAKDVTFQILAFGRGGMKASDNAFWVKEHFDLLQPDIVITLLGINDLVWNGGSTYRYENIGQRFAERERVRKTMLEKNGTESLLSRYSQICRRIQMMNRSEETEKKLESGESIEWHSANLPGLRERYRRLPYAPRLQRNPDPIFEFSEAVTWLVQFLRQRNTQVIVLGQPVLWKDSLAQDEFDRLWFPVTTPRGFVRTSGAWLHKEMSGYNAVQQSVAEQFGVPYLDLDAVLPKSTEYFFDDCHVTDKGSMVMADNILPTLIAIIEKTEFRQSK